MQRGWVPATPEEKSHDQRMWGPDFGSVAVEMKGNSYNCITASQFLSGLSDALFPHSSTNPNVTQEGEIMLAFKLDPGSNPSSDTFFVVGPQACYLTSLSLSLPNSKRGHQARRLVIISVKGDNVCQRPPPSPPSGSVELLPRSHPPY